MPALGRAAPRLHTGTRPPPCPAQPSPARAPGRGGAVPGHLDGGRARARGPRLRHGGTGAPPAAALRHRRAWPRPAAPRPRPTAPRYWWAEYATPLRAMATPRHPTPLAGSTGHAPHGEEPRENGRGRLRRCPRSRVTPPGPGPGPGSPRCAWERSALSPRARVAPTLCGSARAPLTPHSRLPGAVGSLRLEHSSRGRPEILGRVLATVPSRQ